MCGSLEKDGIEDGRAWYIKNQSSNGSTNLDKFRGKILDPR